jgi:acetyl esterase/lipase
VRRRERPQITQLVEPYGPHPLQVGEWFVPPGDGVATAVVLVHGGFWGPEYNRDLEDNIALDLAERGYLCWNIDYRSAAESWPATLVDVAAGYDHLIKGRYAARVDTSRVAVVGHSAGGQLAAWLASRHRLPPGSPGYNADLLRPALAVPQAGVVSLSEAADRRVGRGAAQRLVGGSPADHPDRYAVADPMLLLPTGVRSILIHSVRDRSAPLWLSRHYVDAATAAGDDARLDVSNGDHFAHLDPKAQACRLLREALDTLAD